MEKVIIISENYSLVPIINYFLPTGLTVVLTGKKYYYKENLDTLNENLTDLVLTPRTLCIKDGMVKRIRETVPFYFNMLDGLSELCRRVDVVGIVTHSWGGKEAALLNIGKHLGIPTIVLQNGIWPKDVKQSFYGNYVDCTRILCSSDFMRDRYIELGVDENKLVVTGHPYFDGYDEIINRQRNRTKSKRVLVGFELSFMRTETLNQDVPWFHSPPISYKNYFLMYEVASRMPDYEFIIKLKPHGHLRAEHFADAPANVKVVNDMLVDWLDKVDVVVAANSTLVGESIFVGIPTIVPKQDMPFWDYMEAAKEIDWTVENICNAIENSIGTTVDNEKFNSYYFSHNLDYNSLDRVVKSIEEVINDKCDNSG